MRALAKGYPDEKFVQQFVAQIPWFHNCLLLDKVKLPARRAGLAGHVPAKDTGKREWYIQSSILGTQY